jgi:hypothetical protein
VAIIIRGKTKCGFCGAVIEDGQQATTFGHFVGNESDPLAIFNDGAFHLGCFRNHPLADKAQKRSEELLQRLAPGNRVCVVCNEQIMDPDDYFTLYYLTDNPSDPLYDYNYTQAHSSCLPKWAALRRVSKLVKDLHLSGSWRGNALESVLLKLEEALKKSEECSH